MTDPPPPRIADEARRFRNKTSAPIRTCARHQAVNAEVNVVDGRRALAPRQALTP
jgi:hypothetical protein